MPDPPAIAGRTVVLPPLNIGYVARAGDDVDVAVTVQVGCAHALRLPDIRIDHTGSPSPGSVVFVPANGVGVEPSAQYIHVAVAVQVGRVHVKGREQCAGHSDLGPAAVAWRAIVHIPGELTVVGGRCQDVQIAVVVHVRGLNCERAVVFRVDCVPDPPAIPRGAVVLEPGDVIRGERRSDQVDVAVAIDVPGVDRVRVGKVRHHNVFGPTSVPWGSVVLPPRDLTGLSTGPDHIVVAVTVKIGRMDRYRPSEVGVDAALSERECLGVRRRDR